MCTELTTTTNWETSITNSSPSYIPSQSETTLQLRLLTLPTELRLAILGYVIDDNIIPALKYSEFCRLFLSAPSKTQTSEIKGIGPCTCRASTDVHSLLHVNRQLRKEYIDVLKQNANILICHCNLFSKIYVLEESLSFTKERISHLRRISFSVKQPPARGSNDFLGDGMIQTWPCRDNEHRRLLSSLGVFLTMFVTINCIDAFANLEEISIFLEISRGTTFEALDKRDMETILEIALWKLRSRLARLQRFHALVNHGTSWKRQSWDRLDGVWTGTGTLKSSC
ncbi:Succinate dehydrogenase iron-sulfur subunit [Venturia nashicola]|nr:Succinate dehydrogenase iron-sulfur subunit [Venturia nashicola]